MITIQILGLDQFVVGRYSRENSEGLALAFGRPESDISFFAPNAMMFHNGVEQTSWNTLVVVLAPSGLKGKEKGVAEYLTKTLSLFSINVEVVFQYFDESSHYASVNEAYPRFITTEEIHQDEASLEFGDVPEQMDGEEEDEMDSIESKETGEVYLGDAFEGFEERYEKLTKKKN
ncbi:MAG: hypothetical protein K6E59_05980 [Bacilli bacterium]|nr:hypothetical protein [Bacilli bacterium]